MVCGFGGFTVLGVLLNIGLMVIIVLAIVKIVGLLVGLKPIFCG